MLTRHAFLHIVFLAFTTLTIFMRDAHAQAGPPPQFDSVSPGGVSYINSAFVLSETDLKIGQGEFPYALILERTYQSSQDPESTVSLIRSQGWSSNLGMKFSQSQEYSPYARHFSIDPNFQPYQIYSISIANRSRSFFNSTNLKSGQQPGTYVQSSSSSGDYLEWDAPSMSYIYTSEKGDILKFAGAFVITEWLAADGTKLTFTYENAGRLKSVFSNRGMAILFELGAVTGGYSLTKACAVNLANVHVLPTSPCPAGVSTATYSYRSTPGTTPTSAGPILESVTNAVGVTNTYGYDARSHLNCVKRPGQTACEVFNTYSTCYRWPTELYDPPLMHLYEAVTSQTFASGETLSYDYTPGLCPPRTLFSYPNGGEPRTVTRGDSATTAVKVNSYGMLTSITNEIGQTRLITYDEYNNLGEQVVGENIVKIVEPEGNIFEYQYDARGNRTQTRMKAKPSSGAADIVTTSTYASTCTNRITCNKPTSTTDAQGNSTTYTYDNSHGGVLTEVGPAVNGISPVKRYAYTQRSAWLKNAGGSYTQAASPVWLLAEERTCRTTATIGTACAGGASDEIVVSYDYGPDTGAVGNILLLRGKLVTASGVSERSCYGYDANGNKTSETSPRAGLTSCY